jgi:hypothetical protein
MHWGELQTWACPLEHHEAVRDKLEVFLNSLLQFLWKAGGASRSFAKVRSGSIIGKTSKIEKFLLFDRTGNRQV